MLQVLDTLSYELSKFSFFSVTFRLVLTVLLGGLVGIERGRRGRAAGMRTHILVCLGSALTMLVGLYAEQTMHGTVDPLRLSAQVISGIGFLGAGTILIKERQQVTGLTTAAGLWATAAVGLAIGIGFLKGAILATMLILLANRFLPALERFFSQTSVYTHVYIELSDPNGIQPFLDHLKGTYPIEMPQIVPAKSGLSGNLGLELELHLSHYDDIHQVCQTLQQEPYVAFIVENN